MANITITERSRSFWTIRLRSVFWFVALWIAGVGGAMLLALPFKLLIKWGASAGF